MMGPLVKTGYIGEPTNLLLAVLIGFVFGFALQRGGFTDSRKIAGVFYLKDLDVPVVMFTALVTGMLGLWSMSLLQLIDLSMVYFLPTYLSPMMIGGFLLGIGMVIGGFCPGTSVAAASTGKVDAMVFLGGFFVGTWAFGDLFPFWERFYQADFRGVFRIDEWLGINLGSAMLLVIAFAVTASLTLRGLQQYFWRESPWKIAFGHRALAAAALAGAAVLALFPTSAFYSTTRMAGSITGWQSEWQDPREPVLLAPLKAGRLLYDNLDRAMLLDLRQDGTPPPAAFRGLRRLSVEQIAQTQFPEGALVVVAGEDTRHGLEAVKFLRSHMRVRAFAVEGGFDAFKRLYLEPDASLPELDAQALSELRTQRAALLPNPS